MRCGPEEAGPPRQREERRTSPPKVLDCAFREEGEKLGQGQVSALSTLLSLRTVVEVTGHAHVLLAAFEKVSAVVPLAWGGKRGGA